MDSLPRDSLSNYIQTRFLTWAIGLKLTDKLEQQLMEELAHMKTSSYYAHVASSICKMTSLIYACVALQEDKLIPHIKDKIILSLNQHALNMYQLLNLNIFKKVFSHCTNTIAITMHNKIAYVNNDELNVSNNSQQQLLEYINFNDKSYAKVKLDNDLNAYIIKDAAPNYQDKLTGCYSRSLLDTLPVMINHICLCFIDIDDFKQINDNYGHQVGDQLLQKFSSICKQVIRKEDLLIRMGGDEFLLIIKNVTKMRNATNILKRIYSKIALSLKPAVTCSMGGLMITSPTDIHLAIKQADHLMYDIKKNGKGFFQIEEYNY